MNLIIATAQTAVSAFIKHTSKFTHAVAAVFSLNDKTTLSRTDDKMVGKIIQ